MNKIVLATAKLVRVIRSADATELEEALDTLNDFGNSWLRDGTMENLPGLNDCCLADTDTTEPIKDAISTQLANLK